MDMDKEKRGSHRYVNNGSITLSFTPSRSRNMKARLVNVSDCGLCFCSDFPLVPGTTVFIRASEENYENLESDAVCRMRTMGMAVIKWCREKKSSRGTDHEIGAAYLVHY